MAKQASRKKASRKKASRKQASRKQAGRSRADSKKPKGRSSKSADNEIQITAWGPEPRDEHDDPDGVNYADILVVGDHKEATFDVPILWRSSAISREAKMFLFVDGTCHWRVERIRSTEDDSNWGAKFFFRDNNNTLLVQWPKIWSGTLTGDGRRWDRFDLAIPQAQFPFVTKLIMESYV